MNVLRQTALYLDDTANATMLEIASKSRRLKLERKALDLVVIDYLQLMEGGGRYENRNLEIGAMSRGLKQLAKQLEVPVLCLSQLSRQPERRGTNKKPQLSDLRESGNIEQDADIVMFVYRDEYYHPDVPDNKGMADLIIAKNRHGEARDVQLAFQANTTTFRNFDFTGRQPPEDFIDGGFGERDFDPRPPRPPQGDEWAEPSEDDDQDLLDL